MDKEELSNDTEDGVADFPQRSAGTAQLQPIVEAWAACSFLHDWAKGADRTTIAAAEGKLGRRLPDDFRAIYEISDGISLFDGDLTLESLFPRRPNWFGVATSHEYLKELSSGYRDEFPDELLIFGSNGGDEEFALWLPRDMPADYTAPVIMVGEGGYSDLLAVASTNLIRFLKGTTAAEIVSCMNRARSATRERYNFRGLHAGEIDYDGMMHALRLLGVPEHVLGAGFDSEAFRKGVFEWAYAVDSDLPYVHPDPYDSQFDVDRLRRLYGASPRR